MARPAFKRWWTRLVPRPVERTTFVLFASLACCCSTGNGGRCPGHLDGHRPARRIRASGDLLARLDLVLLSTFMINHFELFGLRQVWRAGSRHRAAAGRIQDAVPLQAVRHPIYLGFLLAFWATPTMTAGHLLFAVATTGYILIGI